MQLKKLPARALKNVRNFFHFFKNSQTIFLVSESELAEIAQEIKDELSTSSKSMMKICNPSASILLECIYHELFKVCPKKLTRTSSECMKLKEFAIQCDDW